MVSGVGSALFHLALPVDDLDAAAHFYGEVLGCRRGRSSSRWIDFDFWGHQLVTHQVPPEAMPAVAGIPVAGIPVAGIPVATNPVDGEDVPASHFGVILAWDQLQALTERLREREVPFVIEPVTRFAGRRGEQRTLFIRDPAGNYLEFKAFRNIDMLFASDGLDYP